MAEKPALLLIAHGSRYPGANADLEWVADRLRERGAYGHVQPSYLELAEPGIEAGGVICAERGASRVVMVPYFLSAGLHVREDLKAARDALASRFPEVDFQLAEPMGRHPSLVDVIDERAAEVLAS